MKQTYPKFSKNSDLSRGCTDTAARVRPGSQGDGGHENNHKTNGPLNVNESMHLTPKRRKG